MAAGVKDRRIIIQRRNDVDDSFGQPIEGYSTIATVWAEFKPQTGGEAFHTAGEQRAATQTATFGIRYRTGIEPKMRIVFDGNNWDITDVAEPERRRELILTAYTRQVVSGAS